MKSGLNSYFYFYETVFHRSLIFHVDQSTIMSSFINIPDIFQLLNIKMYWAPCRINFSMLEPYRKNNKFGFFFKSQPQPYRQSKYIKNVLNCMVLTSVLYKLKFF